jgi:hypothetical protein
MEAVDINLVRIVVAASANLLIGAVWYSPAVFGKKWMKLTGRKQSDIQKDATTSYLGNTVGAFITAFVLAYFVAFSEATTLADGALLGILAWLGFVVTSSLAKLLMQGGSKDLYVLDNGYHFLAYLVMGAILAF